MKKIFALYFLTVFAFSVLLGGIAIAKTNEQDFYSPWQFICRGVAGTTAAEVTIEAFADQNVIIDKIYISTDKPSALVTIFHMTREATAFNPYRVSDIAFTLASSFAGTGEIQVLGSGNPEIPLWIGDKGHAVTISAEGTANVDLIVNGRRGTMNPRQPSSASERGS